jgi:hypothetical protein
VLSIGLHPRSLDYSTLPDGVMRPPWPHALAAATPRCKMQGSMLSFAKSTPRPTRRRTHPCCDTTTFGVAMIGGGIRMVPENTLLFERIVSVLLAVRLGSGCA